MPACPVQQVQPHLLASSNLNRDLVICITVVKLHQKAIVNQRFSLLRDALAVSLNARQVAERLETFHPPPPKGRLVMLRANYKSPLLEVGSILGSKTLDLPAYRLCVASSNCDNLLLTAVGGKENRF